METSRRGCLGYFITLIVALGFIGWGVWDVIDAQACTEPVRGVIEQQVGGGRNPSIEVRYEVDGKPRRATVAGSGQPGQSVNLLYEPLHAEHVRKVGLPRGWFYVGAAGLLVVGATVRACWGRIFGRG
jgi:hypothetical protein